MKKVTKGLFAVLFVVLLSNISRVEAELPPVCAYCEYCIVWNSDGKIIEQNWNCSAYNILPNGKNGIKCFVEGCSHY